MRATALTAVPFHHDRNDLALLVVEGNEFDLLGSRGSTPSAGSRSSIACQ
jgi:hypothetical protein